MARIVIIEDDGALRHDIADKLEGWGHTVAHSCNIVEGRAMIESLRPHVILCDINMPSGSGFSLFNKLRDCSASFPAMSFIFMTSIADPHAINYGIESGADGYIVKPINYSHLKAVIDLNINHTKSGWASKFRNLCAQTA